MSIEHLNDAYFVIKVDLGTHEYELKPGQFFELKNPQVSTPMLKKPISVYDAQAGVVSFMIKRIGKGTELLSQLQAGELLEIMGPLGNSFPVKDVQKAVLVSGGIGYPPLSFLKQELTKAGISIYFMHGGQSALDTFPADEIWTDDGSVGNKGFVTEGLIDSFQTHKADIVYACGPKAMLKHLSTLCAEFEIPLYVSLEEYMACGIGVCHGCAVKVKTDNAIGVTYKTVCKDGPVFDSREIVWE
jgi:dihydroorotate dehydrogenase electron transfer subunit